MQPNRALFYRVARALLIRAENLLRLMLPPPSAAEWKLLKTVRPFTMLGPARLRALYRLATLADAEQIPGAFVECGTCNGGSGAILASVASGTDRRVWLFDSFAGLPDPVAADGAEASGWTGACLGKESSVREVLEQVGADRDRVTIVKGWFEETLAASATGTIALLHLDGDWYESTLTILESFYDRIHPQGFLIIDDYGHWVGCRRAVDEFFARRGVTPRIVRSDYTGVWLRKPSPNAAAEAA